MHDDVTQIKERLNIVDIVSDHVRLVRAGGGTWKGICPFHKEKSPSFTVSEERQLWHCFGCGKGGDLFTFVMDIDGMHFREALEALAERAGVTLTGRRHADTSSDAAQSDKKTLYALLEMSAKFYTHCLTTAHGAAARHYLQERGITDEDAKTFRLGFAPDGWRHLSVFLQKRQFTSAQMVHAGMVIPKEGGEQKGYDRFRGRIMFPIMDAQGRVIGFSGRVLPGADDRGGKYINNADSPVYHKGQAFYGLAQAKDAMKHAERAVIVEGNLDVIALHRIGIRETVAVSGTAMTDDHARILRRYVPHVVLFFDNDLAGVAAARKSTIICARAGLSVSMVVAEGGKDAAEMALTDPAALRHCVSEPNPAPSVLFARAVANHAAHTPHGRQAILAEIIPVIAAHTTVVDQEYWSDYVARHLAIPPHAVADALAHADTSLWSKSEEISSEVPVLDRADVQKPWSALERTITIVAAHADPAFQCLVQYPFSEALLADVVYVAALVDAGQRHGAASCAAAIARCPNGRIARVLESALCSALPEGIVLGEDYGVQEMSALCQRLESVWHATRRAQLTEDLAQAEQSGDRERVAALLAEIAKAMHST